MTPDSGQWAITGIAGHRRQHSTDRRQAARCRDGTETHEHTVVEHESGGVTCLLLLPTTPA